MRGLLARVMTSHSGGHWREDRVVESAFADLEVQLPDAIRKVVEGQQSLALDAKADREALIRDLIEALC